MNHWFWAQGSNPNPKIVATSDYQYLNIVLRWSEHQIAGKFHNSMLINFKRKKKLETRITTKTKYIKTTVRGLKPEHKPCNQMTEKNAKYNKKINIEPSRSNK